jgi:hypothetical protein
LVPSTDNESNKRWDDDRNKSIIIIITTTTTTTTTSITPWSRVFLEKTNIRPPNQEISLLLWNRNAYYMFTRASNK